MQLIPPVRFSKGERDFCLLDKATFLSYASRERESYAANGHTVKVVVVNPKNRTTSLVELAAHLCRSASEISAGTQRVLLQPSHDAQCNAIGKAADECHLACAALKEDLATGAYVGCVAQLATGAIAKEAGFTLFGRPFVGQALIIRGEEKACRASVRGFHLFDKWVDVQPQDYSDLVWLGPKEAIAARRTYAENSTRLYRELVAERNGPITLMGVTSALPSDATATCWACGERNRARFKCTRCRTAYYCDEACQLQHWPEHRALCRRLAADETGGM